MQKRKILAGIILLGLSPISYALIYFIGTEACKQVTYFLCNITPLGILYIPAYFSIAIALVGILLIFIAVRKR